MADCIQDEKLCEVFSRLRAAGVADDHVSAYVKFETPEQRLCMKREFEAGDLCRIRSWDDMEAEFGLYKSGNIKCDFTFTTSMRHLCGMEFEVLDYTYNRNGIRKYRATDPVFDTWYISGDMLEPVDRQDAVPLAPLPSIGDLLW